jgi:hypothetical protein
MNRVEGLVGSVPVVVRVHSGACIEPANWRRFARIVVLGDAPPADRDKGLTSRTRRLQSAASDVHERSTSATLGAYRHRRQGGPDRSDEYGTLKCPTAARLRLPPLGLAVRCTFAPTRR